MALCALVLVTAACTGGGGGPKTWYLPSELGALRPVRAGVIAEREERGPILVVYGPPAPALPGADVGMVVVTSSPGPGRPPSPVLGSTVRRFEVGGGTVDLFTDGAGHGVAANAHGVHGFNGTVRFDGDTDEAAAHAALRSLRVATSGGHRALVLGRPPAGLVVRYGPAPQPPGSVGGAPPGNFADYAAARRRVTVAVGRGSPMAASELAWGLEGGRLTSVGPHRAVARVDRSPGQPPFVLLVWQPDDGVFLVVSAQGLEETDVLAFARSLEPVSERRWKRFMEDHGVDWRHPGRPPDATGLG